MRRQRESDESEMLDTGVNYGHNLFATLSEYLGTELSDRNDVGLDKWTAWWAKEGEKFDLEALLQPCRERRADKNQ
ncbi:MAG: hypothetical protein JW941_01165 [Candidatus Coatesbacteria bacterium]|nr:hypothetical protein [Candidatus Coatesbacteria bacterium]